jgi:hypothetical protein
MNPLSRRTLLRGAGVAIGLPLLDAMQPSAFAAQPSPKRRMVAVNVGLGMHAPNVIPTEVGRNFQLPPYLKVIEAFRDNFTVISGSSHPGVGGGHISAKSYLTAARHPNSAGFKNTISLDQFAAEQLGSETRFSSLTLTNSSPGLSWSRSGVEIPAESRPSRLFQKMFLEGKPAEKAAQIQRLKDGQSVLDAVMGRTANMQRRLGGRDREKIEQYFGALREAEQRLVKAQAWERRPRPKIDVDPPRDQTDRTRVLERLGLMYDIMHLAIETDSTRFMTFYDTGMNAVPQIAGVDTDYHMLSHHAKDPEKISQLTIVETEMMKVFGRFLAKLAQSQESGASLLDNTMVLFGSNLGNASSHDTKNMPIILAGGGFRHGQHLAFDRSNNYPLPNLFVSMLQRLGLETDTFASGTGPMEGLEMV